MCYCEHLLVLLLLTVFLSLSLPRTRFRFLQPEHSQAQYRPRSSSQSRGSSQLQGQKPALEQYYYENRVVVCSHLASLVLPPIHVSIEGTEQLTKIISSGFGTFGINSSLGQIFLNMASACSTTLSYVRENPDGETIWTFSGISFCG